MTARRVLRVAGLDPSLVSFGGALAGRGMVPELHRWRTKKKGHERLDDLLCDVIGLTRSADLVVVEGLAYAARSSSLLDLAGLHWLVLQALWNDQKPYAVVPPTVRTKWLTGKGNSSKDECLAAAIKRFPTADVCGNDEADALTLAAMGLAHVSQPLVRMPVTRAVLLGKVSWPTIKEGDNGPSGN